MRQRSLPGWQLGGIPGDRLPGPHGPNRSGAGGDPAGLLSAAVPGIGWGGHGASAGLFRNSGRCWMYFPAGPGLHGWKSALSTASGRGTGRNGSKVRLLALAVRATASGPHHRGTGPHHRTGSGPSPHGIDEKAAADQWGPWRNVPFGAAAHPLPRWVTGGCCWRWPWTRPASGNIGAGLGSLCPGGIGSIGTVSGIGGSMSG